MDRGLTTIKAVVIGLGLLIVGVTVILVMAAIDKAGEATTSEETAASAPAPTGDFADVAVALPTGARIVTMTGAGDQLSLLVQLPGGAQSIVTIDRRSGEVLGTLELLPRTQGE
jgi:hypothetical protein